MKTRNVVVVSLVLAICLVLTCHTVALADGNNDTPIETVVVRQRTTDAALVPKFVVNGNGSNVVYEENWTDDSTGTLVYWWKEHLEAAQGFVFTSETKVQVTGGSKVYAELQYVNDYEAILYISTRRIFLGENGSFENRQISGINPTPANVPSNSGIVANPTAVFLNYQIQRGNDENTYCYLNGQMLTGWIYYRNNWYYFTPVATDIYSNNQTVHLPIGAMVYNSWVQDGNYCYFLKLDGTRAISQWINGIYVNEVGIACQW